MSLWFYLALASSIIMICTQIYELKKYLKMSVNSEDQKKDEDFLLQEKQKKLLSLLSNKDWVTAIAVGVSETTGKDCMFIYALESGHESDIPEEYKNIVEIIVTGPILSAT